MTEPQIAPLRAPYPYFGGKSRVAAEVWARLGDVPNYVEPFFGSGAVLLARPHAPRIETVNDLDGFVSNFWRAVRSAPDEVARWCDYPVIERDLEARHFWLVTEGRSRIERLAGDPEAFDSQVAGWWCWGLSTWIGGGWCAGTGPHAWLPEAGEWGSARREEGDSGVEHRKPFLSGPHQGGINSELEQQGIPRRRPAVQRPRGINAGVERKRPNIGGRGNGADGRGIAPGVPRQTPDIGGSGQSGRGIHAATLVISERLEELASRMRRVRVCSGDWSRVCTPAVTVTVGLTGVFLDPPYSAEAGRKKDIYAHDCMEVAQDCAKWAMERGDDPQLRIAFCGYDGEHQFPASWKEFAWKANGGYGNRTTDGQGRVNAERERVWFSPHCLQPEFEQRSLFETEEMELE